MSHIGEGVPRGPGGRGVGRRAVVRLGVRLGVRRGSW